MDTLKLRFPYLRISSFCVDLAKVPYDGGLYPLQTHHWNLPSLVIDIGVWNAYWRLSPDHGGNVIVIGDSI